MIRILWFLLLCGIAYGQQLAINEWAVHLNYSHTNTITHVHNKTFVGTQSGLFVYDLEDNSIRNFSKIDGLSSLDITALAYDNTNDGLIIGYKDGNVDIMINNQITNIPHIEMSNILSEKNINHIFIDEDFAYLSCPFGLVVLDLVRIEIKETYYFPENGINAEIFQSHIFDEEISVPSDNFLANKIFVGTSSGLFYANKNGNLLDFSVWKNDSKINLQGIVYELDGIPVKQVIGFKKENSGEKTLVIGTDINYSKFTTPWSEPMFNFFKFNTEAYLNLNSNALNSFNVSTNVTGQITSIKYNQIARKITVIADESGEENIILFTESLQELLSENLNTINNIDVDLSVISATVTDDYNNSGKIVVGGKKSGLVVLTHNTNTLSFLELIVPNGPAGINIGSIASNGNKIMFTHGGKTTPWNNTYNTQEISLFQNSIWSQSSQLKDLNLYDAIAVCGDNINTNKFFVGTWNNGLLEFIGDSLINHYNQYNSSLETITDDGWIRIGGIDVDNNNTIWMTNSQAEKPLVKFSNGVWESVSVPNLSNNIMAGKILCTSGDQKWIQLRNDGLLVAKESGKGIVSKKLSTVNGLASQTVNCFAEDDNGAIWIGTSQGLSVCYFPDNIFNDVSYSVESILIETEDGYVEKLFENTEILDIKIDGANRKWVGTKANGVFLVSDDGTNQIKHFTKDNSPLLENSVNAIAILDKLGEVFFLTPLGLCSYRSNATESNNNFQNVLVFPNPVQRDYNGEIAISGLRDNTNIKITDISGNLVFETFSLGGTATWNGKNFSGEKVATGVYLFLCTDENFQESIVSKILIYN